MIRSFVRARVVHGIENRARHETMHSPPVSTQTTRTAIRTVPSIHVGWRVVVALVPNNPRPFEKMRVSTEACSSRSLRNSGERVVWCGFHLS